MPDALTALQRALLREFFRVDSTYFLTGGAALAGFYLGHRTTLDLDLFTCDADLDDGERLLRAAVEAVGGGMESIRTSPGFRRHLVKRGDESCVVDLVIDHAPQIFDEKLDRDGVRVDPPEEILANKLCALLARGEVRDIVDTRALEESGLELTTALENATRKDAGLSAAQLAWVLSEISIGDDAVIPGGVSAPELREYVRNLRKRLARMSHPEA